MWKQMLRRQGSLRRGRSRSLALEASIWRRFSTCPLTSLSSSSPPALGGGNPTRRAAEISFYSYVKYEADIYAYKCIYICSCLWICVFHTYVTCLHLALGFNGVWRGSRWHWSRSCAKRSVVIFVLLIYGSRSPASWYFMWFIPRGFEFFVHVVLLYSMEQFLVYRMYFVCPSDFLIVMIVVLCDNGGVMRCMGVFCFYDVEEVTRLFQDYDLVILSFLITFLCVCVDLHQMESLECNDRSCSC